MRETGQETALAGVKITPAILGTMYYGFTLEQWVAILTICYVLLQIGLLIPKYYQIFKKLFKK